VSDNVEKRFETDIHTYILKSGAKNKGAKSVSHNAANHKRV
jgi:hypothetical protein